MFKKKRTLYLFLLITFIFLQGVLYIQANAKSNVYALIDSTKPWVESEKVLVKYQDYYKSYVDEQELSILGKELEAFFDFSSGSLSHTQEGRPTFRTAKVRENILISLNLTAIEEHQTHYLTITLESTGARSGSDSALFDKQAWIEQQAWIEKQLSALGLSAEGHTTIEGILPASYKQNLSAWQSELIDTLELKELESYQDHRTLSVSYYSPQLPNHVLTGSQKMNLQIALSHDSYENQWKVTIGSPIITIEY